MALEAMAGYRRELDMLVGHGGDQPCDAERALSAELAQREQEIESDRPHAEDDGCPTEKAVLQRFWREHQKQEPVAWWHDRGDVIDLNVSGHGNPLFSPPQREFIGLTDAVVQTLIETAIEGYASNRDSMRWLCRAIESKLRQKNS